MHTKKSLRTWITSAVITSLVMMHASRAESAGGSDSLVPSIDEMASEWLEVSQITHMPSLHNFHEMAACSPNLLGVNYNPDAILYEDSGLRWYRYHTLPLVQLLVDGKPREAATCRWYPYQAVRRKHLDGLEVETTVRMVFEGPGILYRVLVRNSSDQPRKVDLAIAAPGQRLDTPNGAAAFYHNPAYRYTKSIAWNVQRPALDMVHVFRQKPERLEDGAGSVIARWKPTLAAGEQFTLEIVMAHTAPQKASPDHPAVRQAANWANDFDTLFEQTKTRWLERWADAFTPGNRHFSGHLPVLVTSDEKIREIYYRSILTLLVLHRTNTKMCDRAFITSGERAKGVAYFWDTSMWSRIFALLEPEGMNRHLTLFLQCDPRAGNKYFVNHGRQGGGWYAANDMALFRLFNSYLAVTGDHEFLDEKAAGTTVLEYMEKLATNWRKLQRDKSVMLADYGENHNLLECAPAYVHRVPSFNAANVWMLRTVADLHQQRGSTEKAESLRREADGIARAVLGLYKPGEGVWHALHRDGKRVELRHCYDFMCIGAFMTDDLSDQVKREMVEFVKRELLTEQWMRAMSPKDPAAAISDRPDHGPMGAFDAWPALTAQAMCRLGAWTDAVAFVRRTQAPLHEGVYAQAREHYGPRRLEYDAPVRIAMRLGCMRESSAGAAFAEMIISALFGFSPRCGHPLELLQPTAPRGFTGQLRNLRYRNALHRISVDENGVIITPRTGE